MPLEQTSIVSPKPTGTGGLFCPPPTTTHTHTHEKNNDTTAHDTINGNFTSSDDADDADECGVCQMRVELQHKYNDPLPQRYEGARPRLQHRSEFGCMKRKKKKKKSVHTITSCQIVHNTRARATARLTPLPTSNANKNARKGGGHITKPSPACFCGMF